MLTKLLIKSIWPDFYEPESSLHAWLRSSSLGAVAWNAFGEQIVDSILEAVPGGSMVLDRNGFIAFANSQVERTLGLKRANITGRKLRDLPIKITVIDRDDPQREESLISWVVTGRSVRDVACTIKRRDGTISVVSASISTLAGGSGELIGVVITFIDPARYQTAQETVDVTKWRKAEAELAAAKEFSDALNSINMTINSTLEFDQVMQRVTVDATQAIGAESSAILLHGDEGWVAKYLYGLPEELKEKRFSEDNAPYVAIAAKIKRIVAIGDAYSDERVNPEVARAYRIRSMLVVPLIVKDEPIGIFIFNYHSAQLVFSEHQIDFANKLAASLSLALENVRRYEGERDIADTLQEALLTIPDRLPGVEFGHLYHSATEAARVGGDFYDLFELDNGRVGIVIGDVSGKGLEAAAFTALIKNTIQAYAYESTSPASIVAKTNDVILKSTPDSMFVTLFFGILDSKTGHLRYCSAGHPPVLLKMRGFKASLLNTNSPVIGVMKDLAFVNDEITIRKGDVLIGYTDGVVEARYDGQFFGEEGLISLIESLENSDVASLPGQVFGRIASLTKGKLSDDLAILCLSLSPAG